MICWTGCILTKFKQFFNILWLQNLSLADTRKHLVNFINLVLTEMKIRQSIT